MAGKRELRVPHSEAERSEEARSSKVVWGVGVCHGPREEGFCYKCESRRGLKLRGDMI